jgi:hypothetical protein
MCLGTLEHMKTLLFFLLIGVSVRAVSPTQAVSNQPYCQRFVHVLNNEGTIGVPFGLLALDTKTGQLCRTYDIANGLTTWNGIVDCYSLSLR